MSTLLPKGPLGPTGLIGKCIYPASNPLIGSLDVALKGVASNKNKCTSFYLDTLRYMRRGANVLGRNHHQGLARTHLLSDGSIFFFLSTSNIGAEGTIAQFRYLGPLDGEHVLQTDPLTVAFMVQLLSIDEGHPADICFLPDVNQLDSGYLFVTEAYDQHRISVYPWAPGYDLFPPFHFPRNFDDGPDSLFIDRVGDTYYLGAADSGSRKGLLWTAQAEDLFPTCKKHCMNPYAFNPLNPTEFTLPADGKASQIKLIQQADGSWFLLGFRGDPPDETEGIDYVDVYSVAFNPFNISDRQESVHIYFRKGDTSFANTGTHYVENSGRLLISSSYRWAESEGPGGSYVSRVDECPSS
jgi:hypothetical protein